MKVITAERMQGSSQEDQMIQAMVELVQGGHSDNRENWPEDLKTFYQHKANLSTLDKTLLYNGPYVIPEALRGEVLEILRYI